MKSGTPASTGPRPIDVPRDRLESWKEIANYLRREVRTVQRWEHDRGLPVHRIPGSKRGRGVYAMRQEVDAWWEHQRDSLESSPLPRRPRRLWVMAALALAGCVGLVVWRWAGRGSTTPETRSAPLTRLPGAVGGPAFSPDGNQVAFTWNGEKPDNYDIYLQQIGSGGPHRLTTAPTFEYNPAFSPDGRWIAFLRRPLFIEGRQQDGVFVMPALGGPERMIAPVWVPGLTRALAWGPDSRWLIVAASPSGTEPYALMAYPIDGGEPRKLTNPPAETAVADTSPVLSPDGRQVAFLRNRTWGVRCCGAFADGDVFVLPISRDMSAAGAPRQVSAEKCCVSDVAWARNGEILYVVRRDGAQRVMRTASSRLAVPRLVPSLGPVGRDIVVSPQGDRIAYSTSVISSQILRLELGGARVGPVPFISSSYGDLDPRFSPDGKRIVFVSGRSGPWSLWVCDADGSNPVEVVSLPGGVGAPRWSPDGAEIAFDGRAADNSDIWVVSAGGGKPRRLTSHPANDINAAWSHDGRWIYFSSSRTGREELFKTPAHPGAGAGEEAIQVTRNGGHMAWASVDAKYIYFMRTMFCGNLFRISVDGGEEVQIAPLVETSHGFQVTADGIWFQNTIPLGFEVAFYRFATAKVETLLTMPVPIDLGFTVSPIPGPPRRVLFSTADVQHGDLWLVENFR